MSEIGVKNEKIAQISPFLASKISKKYFFQKNSSRASRYYIEEDPDPFSALTHLFYTSYKIFRIFPENIKKNAIFSHITTENDQK